MVKTIAAGEFKSRCLDLMDQVHDHRASFVITKRGRPIAKLVPYEEKATDIFGFLRNSVTEHGDLIAPTGEAWEADA